MTETYIPKHYLKCLLCNDDQVLVSVTEGQMVVCHCGEVSIDETRWGCQVNGNRGTFELKKLETHEDYRLLPWKSLDGSIHKISELSVEHMINILKHLEKINPKSYYIQLMRDELKYREMN